MGNRAARLDDLRGLASTQDGQFATTQALQRGCSRDALRALRARGEIIGVRLGVWRFRVAPGEPDPAVTAFLACWPHAVISHASAARHHGLRRVAVPAKPTVTVPHGIRRSPAGISVHQSRDLPTADIVTVGGVRYTSLARTVVDLADPTDLWETLAVLDDAVAAGANPRWLHRRAAALADGRAVIAVLRDATHPRAASVFRSWLERAAAHVYRAATLPAPEWNVKLRDQFGTIGIVDALWTQWRVISEKEGLRFHTSPRQRRDDARRFNRLRDARYDPRRFTWEDVVHRPVEVAATIMRALRAAGADLDPARIPRRITLPDRPFV